MFDGFLSFIFWGFISIIIIYFFLWIFTKIIFKRSISTIQIFNSLQTDLCMLKERLQNLLDELEKTRDNKKLNDINEEEREERWNRIRKAFEKKEKERDGTS